MNPLTRSPVPLARVLSAEKQSASRISRIVIVLSRLTSIWRETHEGTLRSLLRHAIGCSCGHYAFSLKSRQCSEYRQLQSRTGQRQGVWEELFLNGNRR